MPSFIVAIIILFCIIPYSYEHNGELSREINSILVFAAIVAGFFALLIVVHWTAKATQRSSNRRVPALPVPPKPAPAAATPLAIPTPPPQPPPPPPPIPISRDAAERIANEIIAPLNLPSPFLFATVARELVEDASTSHAFNIDATKAIITKSFNNFLGQIEPAVDRPDYKRLIADRCLFSVPAIQIMKYPFPLGVAIAYDDYNRFPKILEERRWNAERWQKRIAKTLDDQMDYYLGGTPLRTLYYARVPFELPATERFSGHWIVAHPDSGKTNLLNGMILADLKQVSEEGASIIIIDSKTVKNENLIDAWRNVNFAKLDPRLAGKVHIFDPDTDLAINIFQMGDEAQVVEIIQYMLTALADMEWSGYQTALLIKCVQVIKKMPHPCLPALIDLLRRGWRPYERYIRKLDLEDQKFFLEIGRDGKTCDFDNRIYKDRAEEVKAKLDSLASIVPALRKTFYSSEHKIDLRKLIDRGNIIIVNAKTGILRDKGSEFFQRLWTLMIRDAAERRKRYTPTYCYIDEAHRGISRDTNFANINDQCRSAKIAMIVAHQGESQIDEPKVRAGLARCAIKFEAAGQKGDFTTTIRSKPPIMLSTRFTDMTQLPKLTDAEEAELKADMRRRYSITPADPEPSKEEPEPDPEPDDGEPDDPAKAARY